MAYVMIVDDDRDFASAAAKALEADGHEVSIELETATALQSMNERAPDLAILDVMFPENTSAGFELARTLRREGEALRTVPLLMLTAVNINLVAFSHFLKNPAGQVFVFFVMTVAAAEATLGLAIVVRVKECYGTIEEDEILDAD